MDALSKLAGAVPKVVKSVSRRARRSEAKIEAKRVQGEVIALVRPNLRVRAPPLTPGVKSLLSKELFKSKLEFSQLQPQNVTDNLDPSLESFFSQRDYTLANFNEYLMVLAHQGKVDEALSVIEKMKLMGFRPNSVSFIYLMRSCARSKDVQTAESFFDQALQIVGDSNISNLYSTLISVHAATGNVDYVETLMLEKQRKGCTLTAVDYTCQMHAMLIAGKPKDAIKVYKDVKNDFKQDEFFLTTALKACAKDSCAELALTIWEDLKHFSRFDSSAPYNEVIMALAKRVDYADRAVQLWREMRGKGVVPDQRTFNGVLTACTRLGDLSLAKEAITDMKLHGVEMDSVRYCLLMQTYATICIKSDETGRDMCIRDCWELFRQLEAAGGKVDAVVLNSILSVHIRALREADVEGVVLPLFDSYGVAKTMHTYRHLINFYRDMQKPVEVFRLWKSLHAEGITPDFYICNTFLEVSIKTNQTDQVVEALQTLKKHNRMPLFYVIKKLNEQKDLPPRVWVELQEFKHYYSHKVMEKFGKSYVPPDVKERATR